MLRADSWYKSGMGTTQEFAPQNWREYRRLRSWEILVGETPLLRCKVTRDHYSVIAFGALKAISASTPTGEPYLAMQAEAYDSAGASLFWKTVMRHRGQVADHLGRRTNSSEPGHQDVSGRWHRRAHLVGAPPSYAPDLNPDEDIGHDLKHVELRNFCCKDLCHLSQELTAAVERLPTKPEIVTACFASLSNCKNST